jgi:hypothetical protein
MLVFDLSHDRMANAPLAMVSAVQQAVVVQKARYTQAARRIGLTPRELDEMERRVSRGEVERTTLPVRLDAMAGMHHGRIYAIRNVRVLPRQSAYVVALDDGKRVYIPVVCGNLSVVRGAPARPVRIARASTHRVLAHRALARRLAPASRFQNVAVASPAPAAGGAGPMTAGDAAPAPQPASVAAVAAPAAIARGGSQAGFHVPGLGWIAGAVGALGAFWSGGGSSSPSDACTGP